eukprot:tig00000310_g23937.t1
MPRDAPRLPTRTAPRPRRASLVARAPSEQRRHLPACRTLLADRLSGASPDSYCTCSCHRQPLGRPTMRVCATGNSVPGSFYRRPRASSAHCPGAPRTTDSLAPRSAGFVRIACTVEGGRRTAHAQRSATSLRSILLQFDGRAAAPMLAKRPRGSGSSAAPSPLAGGFRLGDDHPVAELAQVTFRDDFLAPLPGRWATGIAGPD